MKGKVVLVGAGPGDPGLITVKGLEYLRKADVVVYDRLIPEQLLLEVKESAELIYAGKKTGESHIQDWINETMRDKALEGKLVVRLKGGDPYLFGRGEEECTYISSHGIECEVIPGVTSAIAVPAYAGIPVTSRWFSPSVSIVTGSRRDDISEDLKDYIPRKGTLVVLMGVKEVTRITEEILKVRSEDESIAIVQDGCTERQRVFTGKLKDLPRIVKENNVKPPAVIVVGEVVKLSSKLWVFNPVDRKDSKSVPH